VRLCAKKIDLDLANAIPQLQPGQLRKLK